MSVPVIRVKGTVVLDWGNGIRLQVGMPQESAAAALGRKPSPATQALTMQMERDALKGKPHTRSEYVELLRKEGHRASSAAANAIVSREAKRAFGQPLPRQPRKKEVPTGNGGRHPSPATLTLRSRLEADQNTGSLSDAKHYIRWLVNHGGVGLKKAKPIVYRELRLLKAKNG